MRKQKKIWEDEHNSMATLPGLEPTKVSSFVLKFMNFLKTNNIQMSGKIIDIGCGKGRNAIYLAKEGFEVYAIDYIALAVNFAKQQAVENNVLDTMHFYTRAIDKKWPFRDNYFDFAIDCFSSIDIETANGRNIYRNELFRTLKPGGYALVAVVSTNDELEKELMKKHPGREKNSVYWPANGKFQKNYDKNELRTFYNDFKIVALEEPSKPTIRLGKNYNATNFLMIIQKPNEN